MEDSSVIKGPQRVAVVIPCRGARASIASTIRACRAIPAVDLVVVVDDGSEDNTAQVARAAGAVAVRHSISRGRASAMETGVKVAAMRDRADWPPRLILFLDPDVGESAVEASALVEAVISGTADCAIGVPVGSPRLDRPNTIAKQGLRRATGWQSTLPLATQRCLTRDAVDAVMPFSTGWGVDIGMTIDLLSKGFAVVEVPCDFQHSMPPRERHDGRKGTRFWDVWFSVNMRRLARARITAARRTPVEEQGVGVPYQVASLSEKSGRKSSSSKSKR